MRSVLFVLIAAVTLFASNAQNAHAEQQMFVILSNADGYGVDRCLEDGSKCGAAVAAAYCRSQQFVHAASYRKVDRDDITGSVSIKDVACHGSACGEFVAILCTR
jgi:hypothetical protein